MERNGLTAPGENSRSPTPAEISSIFTAHSVVSVPFRDRGRAMMVLGEDWGRAGESLSKPKK